jgi:hypothetical protein
MALILISGSNQCVAAETPSFSRDIQPLLSEHCFVCHGPNEAEAGLRLDGADHASATLDSGARAIQPGRPDQSELLRRVSSSDESIRMPPEGDALSKEDIDRLRQWIAGGAGYEEHWAWQPVTEPVLPTVKDEDWVRNPIDRFVLARLEQEQIEPSPPADRATLIQRLSYDLIGLPPEPAEVDAFFNDDSPDAYESLVDRLLDSQHFGERWGRHWLDKARYADSDGYEKDNPRPNAWRYRDWVIDAINRDLPFDQFTVEQLAGDLLPDATSMQRLATAFHRQTLTNTEGGADQEQFRVEANFDRTETTSAVWMALTMTCARCHDHKYDEISQREYYQLFAFFNDANDGELEIAISKAKIEQYERDKQVHDAKLVVAIEKLNDVITQLQPEIDTWTAETDTALAANTNQIEFEAAKIVNSVVKGGADLVAQPDGSQLVSGPSPEQDRITFVLQVPEKPLTGLRIEVLPHESLPANGPGRAGNGNFVLTNLRAHTSNDAEQSERIDVEFATAEADYSQNKFSPVEVLNRNKKTGWAIGGQIGKPHLLTVFAKQPVNTEKAKSLQVVLDQQYGGNHTIGCFRVSTMSGFDPLKALPESVAAVIRKPKPNRSTEDLRVIAEHVVSKHADAAKHLTALAELKKQAPAKPVMKVRVIAPAQRTTTVLHRGDFLQPADHVTATALNVVQRHHPLTSRNAGKESDRLDLARWLVDPKHPLTARVTVNQVWAHLFGRGIVPTLNDFGVRGELPTHPTLLDWLSWQFSNQMNWSRKELIKTIVMSATWRQSSLHRPELQQNDPTNRLLARQNRVRVEAEIVRDMNLAVAGLLDRTIGGPSVFPPLPPGVAELSYANNFKWRTSEGTAAYRRGMYTFFKRTAPHPTLISFDCPDSNTTRLQRETSNTPLQALVTLNNEVYTESAQALARRVLKVNGDDRERLTRALRLCITRLPTDAEVDRFLSLLEESREYYRRNNDDAKKLTNRHPAKNVNVEENAAWVATIRMVQNLDEFIVRD